MKKKLWLAVGIVMAASCAWSQSAAKANVVGSGFSAFDISQGTFQTWVLTRNEPVVKVVNFTSGQLVVLRVCQNSEGGWKFVWPDNVKGATPVATEPTGCTVQGFATFDNRELHAVAPGVSSK